jgi:transposase-like protein
MEQLMRKVTIYPVEIKERVLAKALAPNPSSIVELAKEFNIPYATIHTWVTHMINPKSVIEVNVPQRPQDKSAQDKLQAVIDTSNKPEIDCAAYCRTHGIYPNHLDAWKKQILEALNNVNTKKDKSVHQKVTNEMKQLKRDLHRKNKALAEVSALLILKKKANHLWGDNEED